jgi:hypothetical protein
MGGLPHTLLWVYGSCVTSDIMLNFGRWNLLHRTIYSVVHVLHQLSSLRMSFGLLPVFFLRNIREHPINVVNFAASFTRGSFRGTALEHMKYC